MDGRGLRSVLQPVLYVGVAAILHGLLFLIPGGGPDRRDAGTSRGIRIRTFSETPAQPRAGERLSVPQPGRISPKGRPIPVAPVDTPVPRATPVDTGRYSLSDGGKGIPAGAIAGSVTIGGNDSLGGERPRSEYEEVVERFRGRDVQDWARDISRKSQKEWKDPKKRSEPKGWKPEQGRGPEVLTSRNPSGYLDPRVRMVVTSYPATGIEKRYTVVRYPDLKFRKHEYQSGWWNVYIELRTGKDGRVEQLKVLRPETEGTLETQFVNQVKKEIDSWSFDAKEAEIHVDVRFYVE